MEFPEHKNKYPFRLAAPSFIFPADYITNARQLAPYLDEVELLFFESDPASLPTPFEIEQLRQLQEEQKIDYNIHLPLDLDICSLNQTDAGRAAAALVRVIDLVRPLTATTYTLHLPLKDPAGMEDSRLVRAWQDRALLGLDRVISRAAIPSRRISVETLNYPPEWLGPLVERMDLSICLDLGHVILYGFDPGSVFFQFGSRITICHLHGVSKGKDHLALQHLDAYYHQELKTFLAGFTQTVSLEVFSARALSESMQALAALMQQDT